VSFDTHRYCLIWLDQPEVTIELPERTCSVDCVLQLVQVGGCKTIVWPGKVRFPGGYAPVFGPNVGDVLLVTLRYDGTNYYGTPIRDSGGPVVVPTRLKEWVDLESKAQRPTFWERLDDEE
jgi:hypothetical protein